MKEFLKGTLFFKPDDWFSWFFFIFFWLSTLFVLSIIVYLLYLGVNFVGVDKSQSNGIVVNKTHTNAYVTTTYVQSGKVLVPITQYHPESWGLVIEVDNKTDEVSVSQDTHISTKIGTDVWVTYKCGRLDNEISISDFQFRTPL